MNKIAPSELILNPDGSIYHINLKPEHLAHNIIFVGDQNRVPKVAQHFDTIEFETQKREFKTITGTFKNKRFSVISTGIGPDNIDIVVNELDALVNLLNAQGLTNGNLQVSSNAEPLTSNAQPAYDNLISNGWTIDVGPPSAIITKTITIETTSTSSSWTPNTITYLRI